MFIFIRYPRRLNFLAIGYLAGLEKRFDQLAFTAHGKTGKSFKPTTAGNLRFRVQPMGQKDNVFVRNASLAHPQQEMGQ